MAYFTEEDFLQEMMDPCQFMHWDKEDRPYHLMLDYGQYGGAELQGIPGKLLAGLVKSRKAKSEQESRVCKYFLKGNCRYGSRCRYVHTYEEGRAEKTDKCIFFQRGYCRYGEDCKFKHEDGPAKPAIHVSEEAVCKQVSSPFSPTDEDLKAGRLTRLRVCLDIPIQGSIVNPKPLHHGAYYIEIFVNKREDDVQYLYDALIEKANHPLYQMGMFELCKPGTSCDLSVSSMNLKDTSLFIFGSCVEALFKQSFKLASLLVESDQTKEDERRFAASKLPRNPDGTFQETNLRSLLKERELPDKKELFPNGCLSMKIDDDMFESCDEPARHFEIREKFDQYIKVHDKINCQWCTDVGCDCLAESSEQLDSDDSEWSIDSKCSNTDNKKTNKQRRRSSKNCNYSCGVYPDHIELKSILDILQKSGIDAVKLGDIITFGEYRGDSSYILGKNDRLFRIAGPSFLVIPFEVSMYLRNALKKFCDVIQKKQSNADDVIGIYVRHDDETLVKAFGKELPTAWKYCVVARYGAAIPDLSCSQVQYIKIEFGEDSSINVVAPDHELAKNSSHLSSLQQIMQRYLSCKECGNFASFDIELPLKDKEREMLIKERGVLEPRILSWFITATNYPDAHNRCYTYKGPKEEVEIAKGVVEEFYEGFTWRYGRMKSN